MSEEIIGGLRIDRNNCGLSEVERTFLDALLSNCCRMESDAPSRYDYLRRIWRKVNLLNECWQEQHNKNYGF